MALLAKAKNNQEILGSASQYFLYTLVSPDNSEGQNDPSKIKLNMMLNRHKVRTFLRFFVR